MGAGGRAIVVSVLVPETTLVTGGGVEVVTAVVLAGGGLVGDSLIWPVVLGAVLLSSDTS